MWWPKALQWHDHDHRPHGSLAKDPKGTQRSRTARCETASPQSAPTKKKHGHHEVWPILNSTVDIILSYCYHDLKMSKISHYCTRQKKPTWHRPSRATSPSHSLQGKEVSLHRLRLLGNGSGWGINLVQVWRGRWKTGTWIIQMFGRRKYIYILYIYIWARPPVSQSPPPPPMVWGPPGPGAQTGLVGVLITIATGTVVLLLLKLLPRELLSGFLLLLLLLLLVLLLLLLLFFIITTITILTTITTITTMTTIATITTVTTIIIYY